ncbi:hypothetical protein MBLNU457_7531t1 [Dothideomycetes sp. NU457]
MHPDAIGSAETCSSSLQDGMSFDEKRPSTWRKIYGFFGFSRGYNFPLWIIFAGAMLGFSLARLSYLNISGSAPSSFASGAAPGEWYWYRSDHYRIGITLHLSTILPAGLLMVWQFVPAIRHRFLLFHRINGYIIIILVLLANAGALMICRRSFGGTIETQVAIVTLATASTVSMAMAYYNIKRLQIDQHRAWMLRAMFYLGTIITLRIIMIISAQITSVVNSYYTVRSCAEIAFIYGSEATAWTFYPQCNTTADPKTNLVVVHATFANGLPEQIGTSLGMSFGMAMWLAFVLHLVGVEIYLALTPRESNRLRQVSYERQLERGMKNPGSAGLTADRWGDAEAWKPEAQVKVEAKA